MPRLDGSAVMGRGFLSWFSDAKIEGTLRWLIGAQGSTDGATKKCATHYLTKYASDTQVRSISPCANRRGTPCLTCSTLNGTGGENSVTKGL